MKVTTSLSLIGLLCLTLCLPACHYFKDRDEPLTPKERCAGIKRQRQYNLVNRNTEAAWFAPHQKAELEEQIDSLYHELHQKRKGR